ncbi:hypothetical protein O9K51_03371 [Purpureocillium lavendulum]|uniref:Uncharacterized protein n=1 Tax=Purpureocillium lavendulum TaxID=1247861 RepID=A0AB34G0C2_9HYPO|nr:hypothetical protein O9K51_03371 [Purpureocillium lavendulum]
MEVMKERWFSLMAGGAAKYLASQAKREVDSSDFPPPPGPPRGGQPQLQRHRAVERMPVSWRLQHSAQVR